MLTIYKSSAGSGKTYTLVKSYLRLILANPEYFSRILAVTFTNKATAEIKQRIIEQLAKLANNSDDAYLETIAGELKLSESTVLNNASLALQLILHNYTRLSVQTIDSFFSNTMRSLTAELKLPFQFDIEIDEKQIKKLLVEMLLEAISTDAEIEKQLETFAFEKLNNDKGWNIEKELELVSGELFKEKFRCMGTTSAITLTDDEVTKLATTIPAQFENKLQSFGSEYLSAFDAYSFNIDDFKNKSKGVYSYFKKLNEGVIEAPSAMAVKKYNNTDTWSSSKNIEEKAEAVLRPVLDKTINYYNSHVELYNTSKAIRSLLFVSPLIEKLEAMLRNYRSQNNLVLISDINYIIQTFISSNNAEFVFEKTGSRYYSFLIDEFQDTSNFQWNNFRPLIENALASGNSNLVVGDVKQSIYRWRGGNMKLLYKTIYDQLRQFSAIIKTELLSTNYRSKRTIVEFNNLLFGAAPAVLNNDLNSENASLANEVYKQQEVMQHYAKHNTDDGYVRVEFVKSENNSNDNFSEAGFAGMLNCINDLVKRNYNYSDMAILVRNNTDGSQVASFLIANGIRNIVTNDSLMLNAAPQINLVIHALKFINDKTDQLSGVIVENELAFINQQQQADFQNRLQSEAIRFLNDNRNKFNHQNIYEVTEQLVTYFELNKQPDAYVIRFLELMLELNSRKIYTIKNMLQWWDENNKKEECSVVTTAQSNAITITTIHRSKGLQFRIVLMPSVDWSTKPKTNELMWVSTVTSPFNRVSAFPVKYNKDLGNSLFRDDYLAEESEQLIDNLNLLYVAFTRAEEQLYVFARLYTKMEDNNKSSKLLYNLMCEQDDWKSMLMNNSIVELGNNNLVNTKKQYKSSTSDIHNVISTRWSEKLHVKAGRNHGMAVAMKDFGTMVHQALSFIKTAADCERALRQTARFWTMDRSESATLLQLLQTVINKTENRNWWNNTYEVKNEAEIFSTNGDIMRPDRLMLQNKAVIIVDYKTGIKETHHIKQVNDYGNRLTEMGYTVTEKHLLYLEPFELISW